MSVQKLFESRFVFCIRLNTNTCPSAGYMLCRCRSLTLAVGVAIWVVICHSCITSQLLELIHHQAIPVRQSNELAFFANTGMVWWAQQILC